MYQINLQLQSGAPQTLTEQLYQYLKESLIKGTFKTHEKLPSKRNLAQGLQCSINTVQAAYNQLADEGYLQTREKSGYYVADLGGILKLEPKQSKEPDRGQSEESYRYNFSPQGVDHQRFPFSLWRRLSHQVITSEDTELLSISDPKGIPELRSSIARYLRSSRGVHCTDQQIIISSGTEFLMQLLIQLLSENTVYAIENPGYEKLNLLFKSNRVHYVSLPLDEHGIEVASLQASGADVLSITPSHQFPTGRIMPVTRRLQLLQWANEKSGRYILEDDYDSEFRYGGKPIPSLQGLDGQGKVIYLGAFSKSLSPALRISYMVLPEVLMERYESDLSFYFCPVPLIEQKILHTFIERGHFERHLNRMRNLYRQKRELLVTCISSLLPFAEITGDSAGLHLLLHIHNGMKEEELIRRANQAQVQVYGLSRYYSQLPEKKGTASILLGFATVEMDEIPKAVSLLQKAWSD
ncbi:MAG: GntR family transcriptional regulator / MocR family aminotransferase [Sphaerochaeta sp.]|jgi:GntR family transcriptional regulator/MocR family aminotransferase|nr:PLP-dependent aminotransferase family protein [Spirochaetaceae bacterium]MDK2859528.1 GntR family transcriptional regulator / MocR family aminotransferase [Sphaerochaeta sp.]